MVDSLTKRLFMVALACVFFNGLPRFSEDLDFALLEKDSNFDLSDYFPALRKEFLSYGIEINIESKSKEHQGVQSAFLKGNTLMLMMSFFPKSEEAKRVISNQKIKIKFEVDTNNPGGGISLLKYRTFPSLYEIRIFDEATLFAGKIHAIICREFEGHVKGRDYYDYLFYIEKGTKINLKYLENKLKNTGGKLEDDETLTIDKTKQLLRARFETVDFNLAKRDVVNFISNPDTLSSWGREFFVQTIDHLYAVG